MAFQLKTHKSVGKNIKRLVRKQMDKATKGFQSHEEPDEVVHDARKCFKKVRALLRFVRDELGEKIYREENMCFRDAARPLTEVRDAKVLIETLDNLTSHFADQVSANAFAKVRKILVADSKAVRTRVLEEEDAFSTATAAVVDARARMDNWTIRHKGWSAIHDGLKRVYQSGCRAFTRASAEPSVENLHEWRKQAKYLWYQLQILEPLWEAMLKELSDQVHELTQLLGDDHDLVTLRQKVSADPSTFGGETTVEALLALIDRRRDELEQKAFLLAQRIYVSKPSVFTNRLKGYWKIWRSEAAVAK